MAETVVTGGQGFLGRNLTNRLIGLGEDVCSTYSYKLPENKDTPNISYFRLDVTNFNDCLKLINQENPKIIYHLVAQPLVTAAQRHPLLTLELTIRGAYNLLEAVRQSGIDTKIVVYTTDKVYGENGNAQEGDRIDSVVGPYDTSKVCEDLISRMYAKSFGMDVITLRSANLYGRYDFHWDRLIPYLCKEVIHDRDPKLRSNGKLYRDYIYIDDILDGIIKSADSFICGDIQSGESLNFGADIPNTPMEIIDVLSKVCGKNIFPIILDNTVGELSYQHINFDKAKSLGWYPKVSIEEGIERTFFWYKNWFSNEA